MTPTRRRSLLVGSLVGLSIALLAAAVVRSLDDGDGDPAAEVTLDEPGPVQEPGIATQADVVGRALPDTTYDRLDGGDLRFAELEGRPVVVNLWASWCGPCVAEMPDFQQVYEEVQDRVAFVGVNHSDGESAARALAARTGVEYLLVRDPSGRFAADLEVAVMPTTVFADATGRVVAVHPGELSAEDLRAEIDQLFPA